MWAACWPAATPSSVLLNARPIRRRTRTAGHRAALRAFPRVVPALQDSEGAALSRQARNFWQTQWQGSTFMAVGAQDPVLGPPVMQALRPLIRGADQSPYVVLPQAGHFVQEHGPDFAKDAAEYYTQQVQPGPQ